jgi:hypothetical protein
MSRRRPDRPGPEALLERRYRRLLAWYPAVYRAANAEEMIGVALAGAAPGQRRPSLSESVNLVLSGVGVRLRGLLRGLRTDAWREAAAVVALLGPILIAAIYVESLTGAVASGLTGFPQRLSLSAIVLAAGWSLVAGAAILRWRWAAAIGASLGTVAEAVHVAILYPANPSLLVTSWWRLMLAVVTAVATVALVTRPRMEQEPLTWPVIAALPVAAAALAAFPLVEAASTTVTRYPDGAGTASSPLFGLEGLLRTGLVALLAATVLVAVIRSGSAPRRRVVVLAAPVVAVAALVEGTFRGFLASSPQFVHPVLLTAPQWAALGLVPVLALAAGMILVGRYERMLRQIWRDGAASPTPPDPGQ